MKVRALRPLAVKGERYGRGQEFELPDKDVQPNVANGYIEVIEAAADDAAPGYETRDMAAKGRRKRSK